MKIAVLGYSGSGKSTLAELLSKKYGYALLHLDQVHWMSGWQEREKSQKEEMVREFLDTHEAWVIDGNYANLYQERRLEEADLIIEMLFGRIDCMCRALKRLQQNQGRARPSMAEGCEEKMDLEFISWILIDGRTSSINHHYQEIRDRYRGKTVVLKNQKELDVFMYQTKLYGERE